MFLCIKDFTVGENIIVICSWKIDNFRKEAIKKEEKKNNKKDAKRSKNANFSRSNRERFNIAIAP